MDGRSRFRPTDRKTMFDCPGPVSGYFRYFPGRLLRGRQLHLILPLGGFAGTAMNITAR